MSTFYTWHDIESELLNQYPNKWDPSWKNIEVYPDEIVITVDKHFDHDKRIRSQAALHRIFGMQFQNDKVLLNYQDKTMDLTFEVDEEDEVAKDIDVKLIPLFKQLRETNSEINSLPGVPVVAFHSYKGGVGRTLSLMAFIRGLSKTTQGNPKTYKTLIVDGDSEAPGLTWLVKEQYPVTEFSWYDALALVHDSQDWSSEVVPFVVDKVKQTPIRIPVDGKEAIHYFLPAYRDYQQLISPPITPEHLVRLKGREWVIGNFLSELGKKLEVDFVVVDLRAGVSEYSAPLILDPRVRNFFITSTSLQSIEGTRELIKSSLMSGYISDDKYPNPIVLVTMATEDVTKNERKRDEIISKLKEPFNQIEDYEADIRFIDFAQELVHLEGLSSIDRKLSGTHMEKQMATVIDEYVISESSIEYPPHEREHYLHNLIELSRDMEFAEQSLKKGFLQTSSLKNLFKKFEKEIPIAVILGAKGSGKTFNYLQLIHGKTWESIANVQSSDKETIIFPLLMSSALEDAAINAIKQQLDFVNDKLSIEVTLQKLNQIVDNIKDFDIYEEKSEVQWKKFWIEQILFACGIDTLESLNESLTKINKRVTFTFDGIENVFQEVNEVNSRAGKAIRALCEGLVNEWRMYPKLNTGLLIFIRTDIAQAAIKQNFNQFRALYKPYELNWTHTEVLRLVLWMAKQAGIPLYQDLEIDVLIREKLEEILQTLWGRKLGKNNSREAYTAKWVLTVLSDLKGRLQARDIVRFLRYAAEKSTGQSSWLDRILLPVAVRSSIENCSKGKVEDVKAEIPIIASIFEKVENLPADVKQIPFEADSLNLTFSEARILEASGYLTKDEDGYYMPEIISHGLRFTWKKRGRRKVFQLLKRYEEG